MRAIVVGIGNPHFGNDSAGIRVAKMVEMAKKDVAEKALNVDIIYLSTTSFEVIDKIAGYDRAFIIDTLKGEKNGRIHVLRIDDLGSAYLDSTHLYGSHGLDLAATLKIGYQLFPDEMPDIEIIAIEIVDAELGEECSKEVYDAVKKASRLLLQKLLEE